VRTAAGGSLGPNCLRVVLSRVVTVN
jgi:hypothetical protein